MTFKNIKTGEPVERPEFYPQHRHSEILHADSDRIVELVPGGEPYSVTHTFHVARPWSEGSDEVGELIRTAGDQTLGFVEGRQYEIDLGTRMARVSRWWIGKTREMFVRELRKVGTGETALRLKLGERVVFGVVA